MLVLPTEIVIPIIPIRVVGVRNRFREASEPFECVNRRGIGFGAIVTISIL